jgi:hypothetical protein
MAEKKPQGLADQLGALIYFEGIKPEKRKDAMAFEKLTEAEQQPFIMQAIKVLQALDKLGLVAQPKPDKKKENATEAQNLDILTDLIEAFVKTLKTTKPGLFPSRELAARILEGPKKA